MSTFAERLNQAMRAKGVKTSADLAALTRTRTEKPISVGHVGHLRKGTRGDEVSDKMVRRLAAALDVDHEWLATGKGRRPGEKELPRRLRHRPEWTEVLERVRAEYPYIPEADLLAAGEALDVEMPGALDVPALRDIAQWLAAWRARAKGP